VPEYTLFALRVNYLSRFLTGEENFSQSARRTQGEKLSRASAVAEGLWRTRRRKERKGERVLSSLCELGVLARESPFFSFGKIKIEKAYLIR